MKDRFVKDKKITTLSRVFTYSLYGLCLVVGISALVEKRLFNALGTLLVFICFGLFAVGYLRDEKENKKERE